jgi:hypothetical protein
MNRTERWERIRNGQLRPPAKLTYLNMDEAIDRAIFKTMLPQNQGRTILVYSEPDEFSVGRDYYLIWGEDEYLGQEGFCEAVITDGIVEV